jgi:hypothetical protein
MNEWTFSGEIFYLKELEGEFAISLKLRGTSRRKNAMTEQIAEVSCLGDKDFYAIFKEHGLKLYSKAALSGHMETWIQKAHGKTPTKTMLIADNVVSADMIART